MSQCLRAKNWDNLRNSWKSVRSTQNIVMNEEFVKHSVVKAKIDPKVVVVSISEIGWRKEPFTAQQLEFIGGLNGWKRAVAVDRNPKQRSIFVTQCLDEGLHVMMQCHMRQHFVDLFWLHEHPE